MDSLRLRLYEAIGCSFFEFTGRLRRLDICRYTRGKILGLDYFVLWRWLHHGQKENNHDFTAQF